ncbi:MAG: 16S rRNA (adenine(1518)-N(6)/adenine(1519)-N(6))-dimethyltransferase RsmA [Patescibacteria group bacterium]
MRLGQHFLKNKKILAQIVQTAELSKNDTVLEVGPGHGELTEFLARRAKKVIAVEKDRELIPWLRKKFRPNKNVEIREGDILKSKILNLKSGYKIVANLPYYLTSRFLRKFLEAKNKPKLMVLMVQYEVAKRICAKPPEMNLLALSVQAYAQPKFIRKVSRGNFSPPPKVDSAIIKLSNLQGSTSGAEKMLKTAKRAFQQKRKMLRHSLGVTKSDFGTKRPQELSLQDWLKITRSRKSQ